MEISFKKKFITLAIIIAVILISIFIIAKIILSLSYWGLILSIFIFIIGIGIGIFSYKIYKNYKDSINK